MQRKVVSNKQSALKEEENTERNRSVHKPKQTPTSLNTYAVDSCRAKECHHTFSNRMTEFGSLYIPREGLSNAFTLESHKF